MRSTDVHEAASQHELFAGLSRDQVDELLAVSEGIKEAEDGELLLSEGETDDAMILLLTGKVDVLKGLKRGKPHLLGSAESVAVLGELALLLEAPRVASVRASGPIRYTVLRRDQFRELLQSGNRAALTLLETMAKTLAARHRETIQNVAELLDEKKAENRPRVDLSRYRKRFERPLTYTL